MMVALTDDAKGHLERYLRQLKAALRGHTSVDVNEVERDVLGHIDAELAGQPEPIGALSLRQVLNRLGAPDSWVPADDLPAWRRTFNRLRSGPEDWRLAYLTIAFFAAGVTLFLRGPFLWPLEPALLVASFLFARATLSVLAEHDEPVGARRWLIYPPVIVWSLGVAALLLAWPLPPAVLGVTDTPVITDRIAALFPGPPMLVHSAFVVLALGLWWVILGLLAARFTDVVRAVFTPFAGAFDRRHARRLVVTGLVAALMSGAVLAAVLVWSTAPAVRAAEQTEAPRPASPIDPSR